MCSIMLSCLVFQEPSTCVHGLLRMRDCGSPWGVKKGHHFEQKAYRRGDVALTCGRCSSLLCCCLILIHRGLVNTTNILHAASQTSHLHQAGTEDVEPLSLRSEVRAEEGVLSSSVTTWRECSGRLVTGTWLYLGCYRPEGWQCF